VDSLGLCGVGALLVGVEELDDAFLRRDARLDDVDQGGGLGGVVGEPGQDVSAPAAVEVTQGQGGEFGRCPLAPSVGHVPADVLGRPAAREGADAKAQDAETQDAKAQDAETATSTAATAGTRPTPAKSRSAGTAVSPELSLSGSMPREALTLRCISSRSRPQAGS
jgi:hypothetical protein